MRGTDVTDMKRTYRTVKKGQFPEKLNIHLLKEFDLRYGENPNQPGAVYRFAGTSLAEFTNITLAKSGKGGLSAINLMDVTRALEILKFFKNPAVAVMKHTQPSGFATQYGENSLDKIYQLARDADARSAFGSVVVTNRPLDKSTAEAIVSTFVEGVAAPEFEEGTLDIFSTKKDLRAILYSNLDKLPKFTADDTSGLYDLKVLPSGRIVVQTPYLSSITGPEDMISDPLVRKNERQHIVQRDPTPGELEDLMTAWYVNIGVSSNGVVLVKNGLTVAIGSGQRERIGAIEQAITKSYQKALDREKMAENTESFSWTPGGLSWPEMKKRLGHSPLEGAVLASDGFLPFRDSIDAVAQQGVTAIVQPGGSIRDHEIIQAVNEHKMAMAFTLERCFLH